MADRTAKGIDPEADGIPFLRKGDPLGEVLEIRYGFDPCDVWRSLPERKDISVEADRMKDDLTGKEYKLSDDAKEKMILAFFKACKYGVNITLHIDARFTPTNQRLVCILENKFSTDDGCMGGGGPVDSDDVNWADIYRDFYTQDNKFVQDRRGIFHYCLNVDHLADYPDLSGGAVTVGASDCACFVLCGSYLDSPTEWAYTFKGGIHLNPIYT